MLLRRNCALHLVSHLNTRFTSSQSTRNSSRNYKRHLVRALKKRYAILLLSSCAWYVARCFINTVYRVAQKFLDTGRNIQCQVTPATPCILLPYICCCYLYFIYLFLFEFYLMALWAGVTVGRTVSIGGNWKDLGSICCVQLGGVLAGTTQSV
jgi:hypothetical protein